MTASQEPGKCNGYTCAGEFHDTGCSLGGMRFGLRNALGTGGLEIAEALAFVGRNDLEIHYGGELHDYSRVLADAYRSKCAELQAERERVDAMRLDFSRYFTALGFGPDDIISADDVIARADKLFAALKRCAEALKARSFPASTNTPMEMERKQIIEALTEAQALIEEK